jgi:hypothetical protein
MERLEVVHRWVATGVIKPIAKGVCFGKQNQDLFFWFRKPGILDHGSLSVDLLGGDGDLEIRSSCDY